MPAYRKKFDKIYEQLRALEIATIKKFVSRIETDLAGKDGGKVVGRVVIELSIGENGMEYNTGTECRKFIEETGTMIELGYTAKLGEKILKSYE
jgi:hypothetical protein